MKYLPYVLTPGHEVQRLYRTCHLLLSEAVMLATLEKREKGKQFNNTLLELYSMNDLGLPR